MLKLSSPDTANIAGLLNQPLPHGFEMKGELGISGNGDRLEPSGGAIELVSSDIVASITPRRKRRQSRSAQGGRGHAARWRKTPRRNPVACGKGCVERTGATDQRLVGCLERSHREDGLQTKERLTLRKHTRKHTSLRRIHRTQLQIMAEVRRRDIRLQLRAATCISFAMDDRKSQQSGIGVAPLIILTYAVV